MSGIGAKLSRHVLGMKFMRKTKDQIDKTKVEKVHREHFSVDSSAAEAASDIKNEPSATASAQPPQIVEELWSYNQCERYIFGRQSFGGFNPVLENNLKKGIWKPFYLDEAGITQDSDEDDDDVKKQSDVDVSDEEMAKTFGSLVGTLAKRFKKKFKKDDKYEHDHEPIRTSLSGRGESGGNNQNQRGNKPKKWSKPFKKDQRNPNQGQGQNQRGNKKGKWNKKRQQGQDNDDVQVSEHRQKKPTKRQHGYSNDDDDRKSAPPQKRRKFMKPTDD